MMKFFTSVSYEPGARFVDLLRERLHGSKVLHLTGIPQTEKPVEFYEALTRKLGVLIKKDEVSTQQLFVDDKWLDIRYDPKMSHTFRHSNTRQPLHTDGAYITDFNCEILFLFCVQPAQQGGATFFLDGDDLVKSLTDQRPALLRRLESEPVIFSKGEMGQKTSPIIRREGCEVRLNWNFYRVSSNNAPSILAMAREFHDYLQTEIEARSIPTPVRLNFGEAAFFRDLRVLHGRTAFTGNRCLIKGVLDLPAGVAKC